MEPSARENLEEFCINRWMTRLKTLAESPDSLDIDIWVQMLLETTNIFKKLGSAMAIAFSDVTSKAEIIKKNKEFFEQVRGEKIESLQHLIEKEVALGVHELNGENNHKKFKKDTWEYNYISTARTTLRNLWLMDFLEELMKLINEDKRSSLSHIGKQAYNKGLGPHHPWMVRQAAKVGFLAAPSRDTFITSLGTDEAQAGELKELITAFNGPLWAYYRQKGMDKLP